MFLLNFYTCSLQTGNKQFVAGHRSLNHTLPRITMETVISSIIYFSNEITQFLKCSKAFTDIVMVSLYIKLVSFDISAVTKLRITNCICKILKMEGEAVPII